MIIIHVDSFEDTARLKRVYNNLDGNVILYNPTRKDVEKELSINDDNTILLLGHGSSMGLFNKDWSGYVFDWRLAKKVRDRKVIGIWCHASEFADRLELHGFFTSMFISNLSEALAFGFHKNTNEDILNEVDFFSEKINELIKNDVPMENWVAILQDCCHKEKDYVRFNYEALAYFE